MAYDNFESSLKGADFFSIQRSSNLFQPAGLELLRKYEIHSENKGLIGFAAELKQGIGSPLLNAALGNLRSFSIDFFDERWKAAMRAEHPLRLFFQHLDLFLPNGIRFASLHERFAVLEKSFDILSIEDRPIMSISSPIPLLWKFTVKRDGAETALIESARNTGGFAKNIICTVCFNGQLSGQERAMLMASAFFVDMLLASRWDILWKR